MRSVIQSTTRFRCNIDPHTPHTPLHAPCISLQEHVFRRIWTSAHHLLRRPGGGAHSDRKWGKVMPVPGWRQAACLQAGRSASSLLSPTLSMHLQTRARMRAETRDDLLASRCVGDGSGGRVAGNDRVLDFRTSEHRPPARAPSRSTMTSGVRFGVRFGVKSARAPLA